ncbi:SGNH/GDSL hydrolase family protein [Staphylococcus xylosus]
MAIKLNAPQGNGTIVFTETKLTERMSADSSLSFDILETPENKHVINSVGKRWIVSGVEGGKDEKKYVITLLDRKTQGDLQIVECIAREWPIDKLISERFYKNVTGSFTVNSYFDLVFKDTGIDYYITEHVKSSRFENAGDGDTKLEMLKQGLKHYKLEYYIKFDMKKKKYVFVLTPYVNKEASYFISDELNADAIKIEEDASEFCTYIKGFGNFKEDQSFEYALLNIDFEHPIAKTYGRIHAEPIKDGRIKSEDTLRRLMEDRIKKSLKQSISINFLALREAYPEANPKVGEIVKVKSNVLGLNDYFRIIEVVTSRDHDNNIVKQDVVLGDFKRDQRYMKSVNSAANYVSVLRRHNLSNPVKDAQNLRAQINANTQSNLKIMGDTEKLKSKQGNTSNIHVTKNGTVIHDYSTSSDIKNLKNITTIGDSVAKGSGAKTNFTTMLAKKFNLKSTNKAISGATMSDVRPNSIYRQALSINDADLVIIQGTDDDWIYKGGVEIGNDKNNINSFYGGFYQAVSIIKKQNPKVKVICMTATRQCVVKNNKIVQRDTDKNKLNLTLEDYVNVQVEACTELDIPVFDAYHTHLIDPYNPAYRAKNMPDGLHPNELAHEVIMYELIKNFYNFYN